MHFVLQLDETQCNCLWFDFQKFNHLKKDISSKTCGMYFLLKYLRVPGGLVLFFDENKFEQKSSALSSVAIHYFVVAFAHYIKIKNCSHIFLFFLYFHKFFFTLCLRNQINIYFSFTFESVSVE